MVRAVHAVLIANLSYLATICVNHLLSF